MNNESTILFLKNFKNIIQKLSISQDENNISNLYMFANKYLNLAPYNIKVQLNYEKRSSPIIDSMIKLSSLSDEDRKKQAKKFYKILQKKILSLYKYLKLNQDHYRKVTINNMKANIIRPEWKSTFKGKKVKPDSYYTIFHGGGFYYIHGFLNGENNGYRLELSKLSRKPGTGIQVTPFKIKSIKSTKISSSSNSSSIETTSNYSTKEIKHLKDIIKLTIKTYSIRALIHFDFPIIMVAKIKAKYLFDSCTDYEAAIGQENADKLKDIAIFFTGINSYSKKIHIRPELYPEIENLISTYNKKSDINLECFSNNEVFSSKTKYIESTPCLKQKYKNNEDGNSNKLVDEVLENIDK